MEKITHVLGKQAVIEVAANHTLFRMGDEIVALPNNYLDHGRGFSRWISAPRSPRSSKDIDRRCALASRLFADQTGKFEVLKPLPVRYIKPFQFWLRSKLTRLGLI